MEGLKDLQERKEVQDAELKKVKSSVNLDELRRDVASKKKEIRDLESK